MDKFKCNENDGSKQSSTDVTSGKEVVGCDSNYAAIQNQQELSEVRRKIAETEAKLKKAEEEGNNDMALAWLTRLNILGEKDLLLLKQQQQQDQDSMVKKVENISIEETELSVTKVVAAAASDYASDKKTKFKGVGFLSHFSGYDPTMIDNRADRLTSATELFIPNHEETRCQNAEIISRKIANCILCNYDLSKVSETSKADQLRNVQVHHFEKFKGIFEGDKLRTSSTETITMESINCPFGFASPSSSPDGCLFDEDKYVRAIWEVKHNTDTPSVGIRQAVSEGTNVAWKQLKDGVAWSDVYVPLIGGNGSSIQFAVLVLLPPSFPYTFMISKILDLVDLNDRAICAGHILKILNFLDRKLDFRKGEVILNKPALSTKLYHLKTHTAFFASKHGYDDSLLHLLSVMQTLFINEECRGNILFPLCIRQYDESFDLVFKKLSDYKIGVPSDGSLREKYITSVERVLLLIHGCGVAHLDFYPSNIMWKERTSGEVHIVIIDWDSAHFNYENLCDCVTERLQGRRLNLARKYALAQNHYITLFDYDLSLLDVLKNNIDDESLRNTDKSGLDEAFLKFQLQELS